MRRRHSILTTVFPNSGFHHWQMVELLGADFPPEERRFSEEPYLEPKEDVHYCRYPDFLPRLEMGEKTIYVDLVYTEAAPGEGTCGKLLKAASGPKKTPSRGANEIRFFKLSDDGRIERPQNPEKFHCSSAGKERFLLEVVLIINSKLCPDPAKTPTQDYRKLMCRRKEYCAFELTAAYRRLVEVIQVIRGKVVRLGVAHGAAAPTDKLHPTTEAAWRLLCSFQSIEAVMFKLRSQRRFPRRITNFTDFLRCSDRQMQSFYDYWCDEKRVGREIVEKKTLEYFIHRSL